MTRLSRFLNLSAPERTILIIAVPLVAAVRLCLLIVPFPTLYKAWLATLPRLARTPSAESPSPERVVWLVAVASRSIPGARCLPQSVAAQLLLARQGHLVELRIGVRKQDDELEAHAWLEHNGAPISDSDAKIEHFIPFPREIASPLDRAK